MEVAAVDTERLTGQDKRILQLRVQGVWRARDWSSLMSSVSTVYQITIGYGIARTIPGHPRAYYLAERTTRLARTVSAIPFVPRGPRSRYKAECADAEEQFQSGAERVLNSGDADLFLTYLARAQSTYISDLEKARQKYAADLAEYVKSGRAVPLAHFLSQEPSAEPRSSLSSDYLGAIIRSSEIDVRRIEYASPGFADFLGLADAINRLHAFLRDLMPFAFSSGRHESEMRRHERELKKVELLKEIEQLRKLRRERKLTDLEIQKEVENVRRLIQQRELDGVNIQKEREHLRRLRAENVKAELALTEALAVGDAQLNLLRIDTLIREGKITGVTSFAEGDEWAPDGDTLEA